MKQIMKRFLSSVAALAMVVTMMAPGMLVNAERTTSVVVTKLKLSTLNNIDLANTYGEEKTLEEIGNAIGSKAPETLPGITFKVYEIEDEADFKAMMANSKAYKTVEQVKAKGTEVGEYTTDDKGQFTANLIDGNYWFIELPNEEVVDSAAVPFGISLPLTKQAEGEGQYSEIMDTVYVYPKNVTTNEPNPEKNVESLDNFAGSVDVGELTDFYLISNIPNGIDKYTKFVMKDNLLSAPCNGTLKFDAEDANVVVKLMKKVNGEFGEATFENATEILTKDVDYKLNVNKEKQTISVELTEAGRIKMQNFHDTADEAKNESANIVVNFKAYPTKEAIKPGEALNKYTVEFDHEGITDEKGKETESNEVKIVLSGKNFVKTNDEDANSDDLKRLEGAEFVFSRTFEGKTEYLKYENEVDVTWVENKEDAQKFVTNKDGEIEIFGLAYSKTVTSTDMNGNTIVESEENKYKYQIEETLAPAGYAKIEGTIDVTINVNSRTEGDMEFITDSDTTIDSDNGMQIKNKRLTIPQTGGIGAAIFAVVGLIIMVAAYKGLKKED